MDLRRLRRVLDKLYQVVAIDDLAGRARQILADLVTFGGRVALAGQCFQGVVGEMRGTLG